MILCVPERNHPNQRNSIKSATLRKRPVGARRKTIKTSYVPTACVAYCSQSFKDLQIQRHMDQYEVAVNACMWLPQKGDLLSRE